MRIFSLFIYHLGSVTPTATFAFADGEAAARAIAERELADSPHRIAVEVREADKLLFRVDRPALECVGHSHASQRS